MNGVSSMTANGNLFEKWMQGYDHQDVEVVLVGMPGSGKSTLARHLRRFNPMAVVHEITPKKSHRFAGETFAVSDVAHQSSFAFAIEIVEPSTNGGPNRVVRVLKSRGGFFVDVPEVSIRLGDPKGDVEFNPETFLKSKDFIE